ncbi:hypothetical protein [Streptomyces sp. NPDC002666]
MQRTNVLLGAAHFCDDPEDNPVEFRHYPRPNEILRKPSEE